MNRDKQKRNDILTGIGVTPAEAALLCVVHYGITIPPGDLPRVATCEVYNPGEPATLEEYRAASAACLAKGWLRVIDEPAPRDLTAEIRDERVLGPVYGLPEAGGVDFTRTGADLWLRLSDRLWPRGDRPPFAYTDVVHSRVAWYFPSRAAAHSWLDEVRGEDAVVSVSGPSPIRPWRAQWWRRFPAGVRVDVERRSRFQGLCGEGEGWFLPRTSRPGPDPGRLRHILDCHNVTLAEWLLLADMDNHWVHSPNHLPRRVSESADKTFGVAASEQECRTGLEACLRYGWLRVVDQRAVEEVEALLRDDPVTLPLSREGWNAPGEIEFTPSGAALYRMTAAEYLGPDWEDGLRAWRESYRQEHRYCESEEGLRAVLQEYAARGEPVRSSKIVPIGPWCVYWWERFAAGYRMELEMGEA